MFRQRTNSVLSALVILPLVVLTGNVAGQTSGHSKNCLYSFKVGLQSDMITPCADTDPLKLSQHPDVLKVMAIFGVKPSQVTFKGCKGLPFSAAPDRSIYGASGRYVITYPTGLSESYIAPITHELAHVLQMEMAGGLNALQDKFISKRIELAADYLAGVAFSQALNHLALNEFQHNLSLIGAYSERDHNAHGRPEQRTASFRMGVYLKFEELSRNISRAHDNFQDNEYADIERF